MKLEVFDYSNLNFVELNTSGDNENYIKCHHTSHYIHSEVFNLFTHCFERSNSLYEYYEPTRYNARQIVPLRNELQKNLESLKAIKSMDQFIEFMSCIFLGKEFIMELQKIDRTWDLNWIQYLTKLQDINKKLLDICETCISKEMILWVIGY